MESDDLNYFKDKLLALKEELESLKSSSQESTKPVTLDQTSVGRLSRMDSIQGQQMALEQRRRRQAQLSRISGALKRIDDGTFGQCFKCKEAIGFERLDFDPTTALCIQCASGT